MQRSFFLSVLLLTFFIGNPAFSGDFHKGVYAYKHGNYQKALREFLSLAEQGNVKAQFNLGVMYENGQGTLKDHARAHMWWNFAAAQGNKGARKNRKLIEKKMSPAELNLAQTLARDCVEKNYKKC